MTKKELQKSMKCGTAFDTDYFQKLCEDGSIIDDDGTGYFHDGEKETLISVFDANGNFRKSTAKKYKFVCWYNC